MKQEFCSRDEVMHVDVIHLQRFCECFVNVLTKYNRHPMGCEAELA